MSPRLDTAEHVRREQAARIGNLHHPLEPMSYAGALIFQPKMLGALALGAVFIGLLVILSVIL